MVTMMILMTIITVIIPVQTRTALRVSQSALDAFFPLSFEVKH